jgi:hypothetical protein
VENVERVVAMFAEAGIETRVTNQRVWAGHDFKRPSYSSPSSRESWPQVWIVKAEDQPRARALLRDAGIEPATRFGDELERARRTPDRHDHHATLAMYLRLALIAIIVILMLLRWFGFF